MRMRGERSQDAHGQHQPILHAGSNPAPATTDTTYNEAYDVRGKKLVCPECGGSRLYRAGFRYLYDGAPVQRWLCRDCGYRFTEHHKLLQKNSDWRLKAQNAIVRERQVCVLRGAKNLDPQVKTEITAETCPNQPVDVKGKLFDYTWKMQKEGYSPATIRTNCGALRALLARKADLMDPECVKEALAREQKWSQNRRRNVITAYTLFLKFNGLKWEPPRCNITRKIPFIPTEQEIDELIAGMPLTVATFLQLLKETAMRSGEAKRLKWTDVDFQRRIITLNEPEKGSLPRIFNNLSAKLLGMLNALPRISPYVFGDCTINSLKATFGRARRRLAYKLQNPRLLEIHFHTLRHWKATMEYHYTKDILHVKEFLGHKEIDNTLVYIQLDKSLFQNLPDDSFIIRAAHSLEEAIKLGEVGFEPFVVMDGVQLFRKRK